jgi:hypothetical protein
VDWSSLRRAYNLLCSEPNREDRFVALADFASILSASIFYDRVIFIDYGRPGELAHDIGSKMNLAEVFVPLSINEIGTPLQELLYAHYDRAYRIFDEETRANAQWLTRLEEAWKDLLPGISFPKHSADAFIPPRRGYDENLQHLRDVIFQARGGTWVTDPKDLNSLVLHNDIGALTYDLLAQTIDFVVGKDSGFFTRYVGGCLRSPLQLARAKNAEACFDSSPPLERWLLDEWVKNYPAKDQKLDQAVRLPFWAGAIFARCNGDARKAEEARAQALSTTHIFCLHIVP